jgi:hypothetical protein
VIYGSQHMKPLLAYILIAAAVLSGGWLVLKSGRSYFRTPPQANPGSSLIYLNAGLAVVYFYAEQHGHLPESGVDLTKLDAPEFRISDEAASRIEYGGNESMTLRSPGRTVILKDTRPLTPSSDKYMCVLLSGETVVLTKKDAVLGQICPAGVGEIVADRPSFMQPSLNKSTNR